MSAILAIPRSDSPHTEFFGPLPYDVPQETVTTTVKIHGVKGRTVRIDRVWYNNPTGFAADASNYWVISLQDGSTVLASWSTQTSAQGALTANTPVELVMGATTDVPNDDVISVVLTPHGSPAALPAGRLVLEGHVL